MSSIDSPDIQRRFENICGIDIAQYNIVVCLASQAKKDGPVALARVQFGDGVVKEFKDVVQARLDYYKKSTAKHDTVVRTYVGGSKPEQHEIEHLLVSETHLIGEQIKSLWPLDQCDVFDGNNDFMKALRFYVIVATPKVASGEPIYFFRAYTPKKELSRSIYIPLIFLDGQFDKVRDTTFLFDKNLDCIISGDDAFLLHTGNFQRIFQFFEKVAENAEKTLQEIKSQIAIKNFGEFADACKAHIHMLAKLNNIGARKHLKSVTLASLKATVTKYGLPVSFERVGDEEQIVFDPKNKWELLRLLDDDYLDSSMTGSSYEATGKRPRRRPVPPAPSNPPKSGA